jgi:hypothetical protein
MTLDVSANYETQYLELWHKDVFASVSLTFNLGGWVSNWTVSRKQGQIIQVIGMVSLPLFGAHPNEVVRRVNFVAQDLLPLLRDTYGGIGAPEYEDAQWQDIHAEAHVRAHLPEITADGLSKTEETAILYSLLQQLGISHAARALSTILQLNVRTVHERVSEARAKGILPPTSQGKSVLT